MVIPSPVSDRQHPAYIDSYYSRTARSLRAYPHLTGKANCEIAIVGGGLAGLTTALELARGGRSVALIEAKRIAWGASGRNGGFCSPGFSQGMDKVIAKVGLQDAQELYRLSKKGVSIVRENADKLGLSLGEPQGYLSARRHPSREEVLAEQSFMAETFAEELVFLTAEETRAKVNSERYFESLFKKSAFHFHPLAYAQALAREVQRLGGQVYEGSALTGGDFTKGQKRLTTEAGELTADQVVFACGGYSGPVMPKLRRALLPIATYVMLTEPLSPEDLEASIRCQHAISDGRKAGDYYRLVEGNRILWGGRITARTDEPERLAELLRGDLLEVYPRLAHIRIEAAWSGLMGYARHSMPQIGPFGEGLWVCSAFGGHGMNTTAMGGWLTAQAILEQDDRYKLFQPFGLTWNGGPFGPLAAQLTYWKLQAQDWWAERAS